MGGGPRAPGAVVVAVGGVLGGAVVEHGQRCPGGDAFPGGDREYSFLVHAPELPRGERREVAEERSAPVLFRLDPWHTYFRILVAFCEPRLRNRSCDHVPGVDEVARRLGISRAAVRAHVSYMLTNKLRMPRQDADRHPWPQQALVDQALRFGLVTSEHLGLLPEAED